MKAATTGNPGQVEWIELEEPSPGPGELLLRPVACGVCSTDVKQVRTGYQGGPRYALGHELVGEVVAVGEGAVWQVGDRVIALPYVPCGACYFCQHEDWTLCSNLFENSLSPGGLSEFVRVPAFLAENGTLALPEGLAPEIAALTEPAGCAVQGVKACRVSPGDSVLVIGDGPMGLLCAAVSRAMGASLVMVSGLTPHRLEVARDHYADAVIRADQEREAWLDSIAALVRTVRQGGTGKQPGGADVVIVAVSSAEAVEAGLSALRPGGVINAFAGVPRGATLALDLHQLHYQQWQITGSFGVAPPYAQLALDLLSDGRLNGVPLVTATFSFEETPEAIRYASQQLGLKAVVERR